MIKRSLIIALTMSFFTSVNATDPDRSSGHMGFETLIPVGKFHQGMQRPGFGFTTGYIYKMPGSRFGISLDFSYLSFGTVSNTVNFQFKAEDQPTRSDISVSNQVSTLLLGTQYSLLPGSPKFAPYIGLQGGMLRNKSHLNIVQENGDDCEAMFTQQLHSDRNFAYRANLGMRINGFGNLFCEHLGDHIYLDMNASYTGSGTMTFMTTIKEDYASSQQHANGNHSTSQPENPETPVMGTFKHVPSGEIHEHAIGTLYRYGMQGLGFQVRVGILF